MRRIIKKDDHWDALVGMLLMAVGMGLLFEKVSVGMIVAGVLFFAHDVLDRFKPDPPKKGTDDE